ncbi:MAG: PD-(D/E)XK nuclease family protein [Acidimicrobiales bacterium]|nr:PD-(D/E)XK nuclease family protein [Acidimicrobiales bacterium]|tara:strand:- start:16484 stop:17458 length:975 start_codon:yes stop_codon:yes gene_type:complete
MCDNYEGVWSVSDLENELNPAQLEVIEHLGAPLKDRPSFTSDLKKHLRSALETSVAHCIEEIPNGESIFLSKHRLSQIHGCEEKFIAEENDDFEWQVATARGTIVHKAIELSVNWRKEIEPSVIVDEAVARLEEDSNSLGHWLQGCSEIERAELRSISVDTFTKFLECWPTLKPSWRPVTESRVRADLCNDTLILSGKVDLTLGVAEGNRAGKVIVDFKTGGFNATHHEDLRYYALVETLRIGMPPRMIASYYLDQAHFVPEKVTEELLTATVRRIAQGVERIVEITFMGESPKLKPGPSCKWCLILDDCDTGKKYLDESGYDS